MRSGTFAQVSKLVVLTTALALTGVSPGFSADMSVTVSGDSKPSNCGEAKKATLSMDMTGSLTGCWSTFVGHFNCQEMNGFALYTEIGREEFAGKLDGQDVKFDTQYTFSGLFPVGSCPEPNAEKEIVGGCIHYISGDGLVGVMRFYDVMFGDGAPHFFYEGTLAKS
jgi:hypothetical protein